jgi:hypothetical protein
MPVGESLQSVVRLRSIIVILSAVVAAIVILFGVLTWNLSTSDVERDPSKYPTVLVTFPSDFVAMVPNAIPASARDVLMSCEKRGGLGPSSLRLTVSYRLEPREAEFLLESARKRIPAKGVQQTSHNREIEVTRGDRFIRIFADPETGVVAFTISSN